MKKSVHLIKKFSQLGRLACATAGFIIGCASIFTANAEEILWSIGQADLSDSEFIGAPNDYNLCPKTVAYVIGESVPQKDWPFMQLGPADAWGGSKVHQYRVFFELGEQAPSAKECKLVLYFKNVHKELPPKLGVRLNGVVVDNVQLSSGQGDDLATGKVKEVQGSNVTVPVPGSLLKKGENLLEISNEQGSWLYYDAVQFWGPQELKLTSKDGKKSTRILEITTPGVRLRGEGGTVSAPVDLLVSHMGKTAPADFFFNGQKMGSAVLVPGGQILSFNVPVRGKKNKGVFSISTEGLKLEEQKWVLPEPKLKQFYLLPHSHVDIGYTHRQDEVVDIQIDNMNVAMGLTSESQAYPREAQFKWNPESIWVVDHYLNKESEENQTAFLNAVIDGTVSLDALYGNLLTGMCRPEELYRGVAYFSKKTEMLTGVPIVSAAICDVPGYTWGTATMMGQSGVKYFAIAPNYSDRIGTIHSVWNDKPFYWVSQSGQEKVLCWVTAHYWKHGDLEKEVLNHLKMRQTSDYPYDLEWMYWIAQRENGDCDNSPPDRNMAQAVHQWNLKYAAPQLSIGTAREFFPLFEKKYGKKLPQFSGDITPYWEDGAGSTSFETGLNRCTADKLSQAETLWALRNPQQRPAKLFEEAWKNVLLYSEHTWGAYCSISRPDDPFTISQWERKRQFAVDAARQAEELLSSSVTSQESAPSATARVWNTTQWSRTGLVTAPEAMAKVGDYVQDQDGKPVCSQRLKSGELVFLAEAVSGMGSQKYVSLPKKAFVPAGKVWAEGNKLVSSVLEVELDEKSGAVKLLRFRGEEHNFVDSSNSVALNDYRYLKGVNPDDAQANGPVAITIGEEGPLVASLIVKSAAPGCVDLVREIRLVEGADSIEVVNYVNRLPVREKDAVHFGFSFNVPEGELRMETPWAVVRPNLDQLPGSCYNWFTVQRWVDISNDDYGVLWSPVHAPLMQVGAITANLLGSVSLDQWMDQAIESQTIYSWAQNNHWHTNYKADQPGVTPFKYVIAVHRGGYDGAKSARFGQEVTRPLVVFACNEQAEGCERTETVSSRLDNDNFVVETFKVSEDGQALIYRLQNMAETEQILRMADGKKSEKIYLTDLSEKPIKKLSRKMKVPPHGLVNLRVE